MKTLAVDGQLDSRSRGIARALTRSAACAWLLHVLSASAGQLNLEMTFSEGTIAVQAPVTLTPLPTGVRGDVSAGRLELRPNGQDNYSCSGNTRDFAFTLAQAP